MVEQLSSNLQNMINRNSLYKIPLSYDKNYFDSDANDVFLKLKPISYTSYSNNKGTNLWGLQPIEYAIKPSNFNKTKKIVDECYETPPHESKSLEKTMKRNDEKKVENIGNVSMNNISNNLSINIISKENISNNIKTKEEANLFLHTKTIMPTIFTNPIIRENYIPNSQVLNINNEVTTSVQNDIIPIKSTNDNGTNNPMQSLLEPRKDENNINKPVTNSIGDSFKQKLINSSNNYWQIRSKIKEIFNFNGNQNSINNMLKQTNEILNQLTSKICLTECIKKYIFMISGIIKSKNKELFIVSIDCLCKMITKKSQSFRSEKKEIYWVLSSMVIQISKQYPIISDFFIQFCVYICPYLIPLTFNKADFPNENDFKKRSGFTNNKEGVLDFLNNMECYSYLYFSYINQLESTKKQLFLNSFVSNYSDSTLKIDYPQITVFTVFYNMFCNKLSGEHSTMLGNTRTRITTHIDNLKKHGITNNALRSMINQYLFSLNENYKRVQNNKRSLFDEDFK